MNIQIFQELVKLGLKPFPIQWDETGKNASSHIINHSTIDESQWNETTIDQWVDKIEQANGIALKLFPPFGTIDFDTKNENGTVSFNDWLSIIAANNPDILRKVCIESTRNNGYHVYIKYNKLSHKIALAASEEGKETIAVYTGGLLSYCSPTPGYTMFHNSFEDLQELTDDEFDLLTSTGALFNKYKEELSNSFQPIEYPQQYENTCLKFDTEITDEAFEELLNQLTLFEVRGFRYNNNRHKFTAYLRKGSLAKYSAKVYFSTRKLLLFTTSLQGFPSWADGKGAGDRSWVLTPSRIIYYKNGKDWKQTIEEIQMISDSIGIELAQQPIEQQSIVNDRLAFPYDIFPQAIQDYIKGHSIQHEYTAGAMLGQLSTAIGNTAYLLTGEGQKVHTNIYLAIVAHAGSGKSPAMKIGFKRIEELDKENYKKHAARLAAYKEEIANMDKKDKNKPTEPIQSQMVVDDVTLEKLVHILQHNNKGVCLLADELAGKLIRMNKYEGSDDTQKFLQMWSGEKVTQHRLNSETRAIYDYTLSIVGSIQPGVLELVSKGANQYNGFYHRFLFVYPEQQTKANYGFTACPEYIRNEVDIIVDKLLTFRANDAKDKYTFAPDAEQLFAAWFNYKNLYYNRAEDENAKGIISKYQNYCLRFALIIQCCDDLDKRTFIITQSAVERAIRLTEYFLGNMLKSLKILAPESPLDNLKKPYDNIYKELSETFSMKTAVDIGLKYLKKEHAVKMWIKRNNELFEKIDFGSYRKLF